MSGPRVGVREHGRVVVATFEESTDLDLSHAAELGDSLLAAVPNHTAGLVVDLSKVHYMDSAGVRMLFALARRLAIRRQVLALSVPEQSRLTRLIEITRLGEVATLGKAVEECLELVDGES